MLRGPTHTPKSRINVSIYDDDICLSLYESRVYKICAGFFYFKAHLCTAIRDSFCAHISPVGI